MRLRTGWRDKGQTKERMSQKSLWLVMVEVVVGVKRGWMWSMGVGERGPTAALIQPSNVLALSGMCCVTGARR